MGVLPTIQGEGATGPLNPEEGSGRGISGLGTQSSKGPLLWSCPKPQKRPNPGRTAEKNVMCVSLGFALSPSLRYPASGRVFSKSSNTLRCSQPVARPLPQQSPSPCTLESSWAPQPLGRLHCDKADRTWAEHPKSSNQKDSPGPPVMALQKGQGPGEEGGLKGSTRSPGPAAFPPPCRGRREARLCWGLNRAQLERPAALPIGVGGGASFPSRDQQDYRRAPGWGQKGQRAPNQGKGSGCGEAEGRLGAGGGRPRCS